MPPPSTHPAPCFCLRDGAEHLQAGEREAAPEPCGRACLKTLPQTSPASSNGSWRSASLLPAGHRGRGRLPKRTLTSGITAHGAACPAASAPRPGFIALYLLPVASASAGALLGLDRPRIFIYFGTAKLYIYISIGIQVFLPLCQQEQAQPGQVHGPKATSPGAKNTTFHRGFNRGRVLQRGRRQQGKRESSRWRWAAAGSNAASCP